MFCFGLICAWAFVAGLKVLDANWRMRFGLVMSVCALGIVSLWPSLQNMTDGRHPLPEVHRRPRESFGW